MPLSIQEKEEIYNSAGKKAGDGDEASVVQTLSCLFMASEITPAKPQLKLVFTGSAIVKMHWKEYCAPKICHLNGSPAMVPTERKIKNWLYCYKALK